jgi:hypothetical protein
MVDVSGRKERMVTIFIPQLDIGTANVDAEKAQFHLQTVKELLLHFNVNSG